MGWRSRGMRDGIRRLVIWILVVCAVHACGGASNHEKESDNDGSDSIETTCRKLESVACIASGFDECVGTLRELIDKANELGCAVEAGAMHMCLGVTPDFSCEGDTARYNDS